MRLVFFNEFNLFRNNSSGITVRSLFGDEVCRESLQIVLRRKDLFIEQNGICLIKTKLGFISFLKMIRAIKHYDADALYTTGNSIRALLLLSLIKILLNIPILVHYFDNWREVGRYSIKNILLKIISGKKEMALVISDEMGLHYKEKYKGDYITLMVGTSNNVLKMSSESLNEIVFLYAGGFHLGRVNALLEIEKEILSIKSYNVKLIIATFSNDYKQFHDQFNSNITHFYVDIPHEKVDELYRTAQVLLFVEPAPEDKMTFLKYSMSTKIPEYLSSGIPILCYAHSDIAPTSYFKRTQSAFVVTDRKELKNTILNICEKRNVDTIVDNAKEAAYRDFSINTQRKLLYGALDRIINK